MISLTCYICGNKLINRDQFHDQLSKSFSYDNEQSSIKYLCSCNKSYYIYNINSKQISYILIYIKYNSKSYYYINASSLEITKKNTVYLYKDDKLYFNIKLDILNKNKEEFLYWLEKQLLLQ